MDDLDLTKYEKLGPFEIKDFLQKVASKAALESSISYLNAGRGNPNWVATEPREAFFLLGQFAVTESKRVLDLPPGVGGMPKAPGIAGRLEAWLKQHGDMPGAPFLQRMVPWTVKKFHFDADRFVHELVDSIIGDHYPVPDRMLVHNEQVVHEYLQWAMCGNPRPKGTFKIYAVEGGTAAMCYIFKSLKSNRLLNPGDTIALSVPIFTPYLEMTHLEDYALKAVHINAPQENRFQFTDDEIKKLEDPTIKAFFVVNPGTPTGVALSKETIGKIATLVKTKRPDLMLLTDDVYGTFVNDFRSLLGELPHNTIGVYSYSKYFGCTGWGLGTIAVHEDNIYDKKIADLPDAELKALDKRYGPITLEPRKLKFIDRIVADSRDVALNHTAGLSLPQRVMMSLFSLAEMMDTIIGAMLEAHAVDPKLHRVLSEQIPHTIIMKHVEEDGAAFVRSMFEIHQHKIRKDIDVDVGVFVLVHAVEGITHAAVIEHPEMLRERSLRHEIATLVTSYLAPER